MIRKLIFVLLFAPVLHVASVLGQDNNHLVYQIFVRSFADTPADTAPAGAAGEVGDLRGIIEQFDYLNDGNAETDTDLEVGVLWLMPIFPTTTYHGYDVKDYRDVNPDYGSLSDLRELIQLAHQRKVRIILDLPINHTSSEHPWFKQAIADPNSSFRKFYKIAPDVGPIPQVCWHTARNAAGQAVEYLGLFDRRMPDLNFAEPAVQQAIIEIGKFWLQEGVDGFRIDAAKHVFGDTFDNLSEEQILHNNNWWRQFADEMYRVNPRAILVGEVLGERETLRRHAYGNDALLDEPMMHVIRKQVTAPSAGALESWAQFVLACRQVNREGLQRPGAVQHEPFQPFLFLASHDANPRLASFLEEAKRNGMAPSVDEAYRVSWYMMTTLSKYAVIYNGDELMQRGFKWNGDPAPRGDGSRIYDETLREPFPWHKSGHATPQTAWFAPRYDKPDDGISVAEQGSEHALLHLVRGLTNLRTKHPALASDSITQIVNDEADWWVFEKSADGNRYLVLINRSGIGHNYNFHADWFPQYQQAQLIFWSNGTEKSWTDETSANKRIDGSVFVPPYGLVVLKQ